MESMDSLDSLVLQDLPVRQDLLVLALSLEVDIILLNFISILLQDEIL
jgi:hypothetical protein